MNPLRPSPLGAIHEEAGGRCGGEGGGYPQDYGDAEGEHEALHSEAGLVDQSDRDVLRASGRDHLAVIHGLSTGLVDGLARSQGALTAVTTPKGRVVDLVAVLRDASDRTLLLCGAGAGEGVSAWIRRHVIRKDCRLEPPEEPLGTLEVMGPGAADAVRRATGADAASLAPWHLVTSPVGDRGARALVVRAVPPGGDGVLALAAESELPSLWRALAGAARPCGRAAYEAARIERRLPAHGRELTEEHNPWELGLEGAISLTKGCYVGQEVVARLFYYEKIRRGLALLETDRPPEAVAGTPVLLDGRAVGRVTSAARVPGGRTLALAVVPRDAPASAAWRIGEPPAPAELRAAPGAGP